MNVTHYDPILIGQTSKGEEIDWTFTEMNNFNALFMGMSGAGKTYTIHNMAARVFERGTTFHVIDIKGDFGYENFEKSGLGGIVRPDDFNDITFDYFNGASINPMQIPRTKEGGGVLMTIEAMKSLVKTFSSSAGPKMLGYLDEVLKMVYENRGIVHDDEETWSRPSPDLNDLLAQIDLIFNVISSGLPVGSVTEIMDAFGKAKARAEKAVGMMEIEEAERGEIEDKLETEAFKLVELLTGKVKQQFNYDNIKAKKKSSGTVYEHWKKDSLYSLRSIIASMVDSRLFTGNPSRTMPNKINRYDLSMISSQHQQVVMRIVASRVFAMGVMETRQKNSYNPKHPSHILIADEGKHVKEISQSALSPFNRIGTEGRGYGVGIWCGVQQPDQVTADLMKNFCTFFVLRTPESSVQEVSRMFGIKPAFLKLLKPQENAMFSANSPWTLVNQFKG
jgi:hypothetical protein